MRPRRKQLLVIVVAGIVAIGAVSGALYRWWFWYRYSDFANLVERSQIPLQGDFSDAVLSPDGSRMFLLHEPSSGQGFIQIIDTRTDTIVDNIRLRVGFPVSLAITPDGRRLLVALSSYRGGAGGGTLGENRVDLVDTESGTVTGNIPIPGRCASVVAVSEIGTSAYVSERTATRIDHLDLTANRIVARITVPEGPYSIVMKPGTDLIYVVSARDRDGTLVSVIDTRTDTVVATVPTDLSRGTSPTEAFFSRDGGRLYIVQPRDSRIAVIDTDPESPTCHRQFELIHTPGDGALRMCINREGTLALVLLKPWKLALLDMNPTSPHYHRIVSSEAIDHSPHFLLHAPPGQPTTVYHFDGTHGLIRVLSPGSKRR